MNKEHDITIFPDGISFGDNEPAGTPASPTTRDAAEISAYEEEAYEKVWLMRCYDFTTGKTTHEIAQVPAEKILEKYNDIPEEGYDDWEYGFWNGVLATLRWVLGEDEKDFLDT
jgi:hypothetical protein